MTGQPDLQGRCVLVVEDEYYIAADAARALQGAGARIIGPCPDAASARAELASARPEAVVLDINLGEGPSFALADDLRGQGVPFVFVTGYDRETIPARFDDIERLQKPVELRLLVASVSRLLPVQS